jgi:hypothetical protein
MKKIIWDVKDMNTGKKINTIRATRDSDTVLEIARRIFGRNVFVETYEFTCYSGGNHDNPNKVIMCQHHDDKGVGDGYKSYIPYIERPFPEEIDEDNPNSGGLVKYDF